MLCYQTYILILQPQLSHIVLSLMQWKKCWKHCLLVKRLILISNPILREISSELSFPLCSPFNHSLHKRCVPTSYKEANVTQVPKKGNLSIVSNYQPISLLNSEDKVFERLVFKYPYNHLHRHNLICSLQSGFYPR